MYNLRKSKAGFTLIELMVVVAIIGVLALLGLRMYTGQQEKAKNAIVKANVGTIQTLIQAELADTTATKVNTMWTDGSMITSSGIHNPVGGALQTTKGVALSGAGAGDVYVTQGTSDTNKFFINAATAGDKDKNVYDEPLTSHK